MIKEQDINRALGWVAADPLCEHLEELLITLARDPNFASKFSEALEAVKELRE